MKAKLTDVCSKCGAVATYDCRAKIQGAEFRGTFCLTCFQDFRKHMEEIGVTPTFTQGGTA